MADVAELGDLLSAVGDGHDDDANTAKWSRYKRPPAQFGGCSLKCYDTFDVVEQLRGRLLTSAHGPIVAAFGMPFQLISHRRRRGYWLAARRQECMHAAVVEQRAKRLTLMLIVGRVRPRACGC